MEVLQRAANRGSISTGYDIDNSLKVESDNSERLSLTLGTPTSTKIMTFSWWFKRTELGRQWLFTTNQAGSPDFETFRIYLEPDDQLSIQDYDSTNNYSRVTNRMFRDISAWYHVVIAIDTTQATASNRIKVYVNGAQETSFGTDSPPAQNHDIDIGSGKVLTIGAWNQDGVGYLYEMENYIAEAHFIDGQQLAASDFGEFDSDTGIWKPIEYTGSYGNNGFYLDFESSGSLGADSSGNGNDFTLSNITSIDQATDTPTNNFCTLNPLINPKYAYSKMAEGATVYDSTTGGISGALGTFGVTSGKWYWECKLTEQNAHYIGVSAVDDGDNITSANDPQDINSSFIFNIAAARIEYINSGTKTYGSNDAFTDFHTVGDVIGIALNMDDNQISIYGNGTLQSGVANSSLFDAANKMVVPFHATLQDEVQYNFGGYSAWTPSSAETDANGYGTFEYAPPSGYYALCSKNLAEFG